MKVLIVAKTRRGAAACIGGITFDGQSVRLIAANTAQDEKAGMEYSIGDIWDVQGQIATQPTAPHVENFVVQHKKQLPLVIDPISFIEHYMPPLYGSIEQLYQGFTRPIGSGVLTITQAAVPNYSTTFWRPDQPLKIEYSRSKKIRYRYPTVDGGRTLTFVGFQEPLETIPAGTLLRVSLSHWWRPDDQPDWDERCYLQLSGWFLESHAEQPADVEEDHQERLVTTPTPAKATVSLDRVRQLLKSIFGYDTFRAWQEEIITNVLARRDTLVVMATGSGKSLCYQLPALCFERLTVVVSPLIALMEDQVTQLQRTGIPAIYLNSTVSYWDYLRGMEQVRSGHTKLLYLAPETLQRPETLRLLTERGVDCLVIDEAHCISAWGYDFRQEYRDLMPVRQRLPEAVCIALTATATREVQMDIKQILGFHSEDTFVGAFDRPNLFIEVKPKQHALSQVLDFLKGHADESGIFYCATRTHVEQIQEALVAAGINALPYHGGMHSEERRHNQAAFMCDDARVIVATVAFGMGVNKPDVRFVVHIDLPQDLESYYQQIGRAGRDGLRADCLLLFSYGDVQTIHYLIDRGAKEEAASRRERLQILLNWIEAYDCRRQGILRYFGETVTHTKCDMCDNCLHHQEAQVDLTIAAQKFLSCVVRVGERFGSDHIIKVLRGSRSQKVLRWHHDKLSTYGIGQEYSETTWKHLAHQFIRQDLLWQVTGTGSLKVTDKGWRALKNDEKVYGTLAVGGASPIGTSQVYDATLFGQLRTLRKKLADEEKVPPYVIFHDRTLQEMATVFPQSLAAFSQITGVGKTKQERYGTIFLAVIQAYCAERPHSALPGTPAPTITPSSSHISARTLAVGTRFANGESVAALQESYHVQRNTIIEHLGNYVYHGYSLCIKRLQQESALTPAEQADVITQFHTLGTAQLRPIFDALNGKVRYSELHLWRAIYLAETKSLAAQELLPL